MQTLATLFLMALCLGTVQSNQSGGEPPSPFRKDNVYVFQYNSQISSGLTAPSDEDSADPQQNAAIRIQAHAKITFASDRHGQLELQQIRVGQLNEQLTEPEKVQPMAIFEPKQIPDEKQRQLELPTQFHYDEGVVERVQFHEDDDVWSKNVKRAVLNMIQLNLKKNNAQGLRSAADDDEQQKNNNEGDQSSEDGQLPEFGQTFNIPEITLEGVCQTTYAINRAGQQRQWEGEQMAAAFNVTKTINFKQCTKIADVGYGFQTEQPQPQCSQCQLYWSKNQQQNNHQNAQQQQQSSQQHHPCAKCDPKKVKEQTLDRSTVLRYQLVCPSGDCESSQQFGLKRTELLSQYVFKQAKSQTGKYSSAMRTIVAATLKFRSQEQTSESVPRMSSGNKDESLMFSSQLELDVKRFYMFGDEEFSQPESSPFHQVPKVQHAQQTLRKLAQTMIGDKQTGIEVQTGFEVQRLVELLRMSRREELDKIEQNAIGNQPNGWQQTEQKAQHIFVDALAICGTRNCIQKLAEKIQNKEISKVKAVQALRTLTQVPAPSVQIVKIVQRLCKQENVHNQRSVKQTCWLTFGALVNELCQHKTPKKGTQKYAYEAKSALNKQEQCTPEKKQEYKQTIMDLYTSSATIYNKVLALSALGNAGIQNAVDDIEGIIKDQSEACLVRCKAIDALRRLRTQIPRKIQHILLPIFQNGQARAELRAAALYILLETQPDSAMIDQIAFTISKEANRQIQSFAYQLMKTLVKSKNPVEQEMAKHIKNALRITNVDEQQLRYSGKWQIPAYSEHLQEGLFIDLTQMISSRSAAPAYLHAQIDSFINDQFQTGQMKLYIIQQEAEDWYQQTASGQNDHRGQRRSFSFSQSLRNIFTVLGIKGRRNNEENNRQPFAMFALRTRDVDQGFVAIDGSSKEPQDVQFQEMLGQFFNGQSRPMLERFLSQFHPNQQQQQQQKEEFQGVVVTNLNEQQAKIPTSAGLPLHVLTSNPMLATIEGKTQMNTESGQLDSPLGVQTQINVHSMASLVNIQKMELALPFMVSGVESVRSVEVNVPTEAELNASPSQGLISVKVKLPRQKHTLFGFHSLPFTYIAQVDTNTKLVHEPRQFRAIHHQKLEQMQHEVNKNYKIAEQLGIPLYIQGHYHWPTQSCTSLQQFSQMLMATENVLHIVYQPNEETPREVIFRISGNQFERTSGQKPQLQDFYNQRIESAFESLELDNYEMESSSRRNEKLQSFIGSYQPSNQYKHSVKLFVQTVGGPKEAKAHVEMGVNCDTKVQACNSQLDAHFAKLREDAEKWTMKIQSSMVMPETVQSVNELPQLEQQKNNKFQYKIQAEWGTEQKEHLNIRLQGEQAKKRENNNEMSGQNNNEHAKRRQQWRQAFLNKFDLEAQYQLKEQTENTFGQLLELFKSNYYWNSQTQPNNGQQQMQGQNGGGKTLISVIIDPITQKHANISIKTPNQQIRLQQIELPIQTRLFPLVCQQQQSTHSFGQFIRRMQVQGRAECTVDGHDVNTFDNVNFNAPLSDACYSVLAKDCSSGEPQFVVLMKAQDNIDSGSRNSLKKLKVITPEKEIVCEPTSNRNEEQQQKIVCKENGNPVEEDNDSDLVEFNNAIKNDVSVHVSGISVRFNGRKVWLKMSSLYKNSQCGLCGHYDDSQQDEWRMSNNQNTNDLAEFHRSYTLKGNQQGEQCTEQELNNFYRQNGNEIRYNWANQTQQQRKDGENSDDVDDQHDWLDEQFDGQLKSFINFNQLPQLEPKILDEQSCGKCESASIKILKNFEKSLDALHDSLALMCELDVDNSTEATCKKFAQTLIDSLRFTRIIFTRNVLCVIVSSSCRTGNPTTCQMCELVLGLIANILKELEEPLRTSISELMPPEIAVKATAGYNAGMTAAYLWLTPMSIAGHCQSWGCKN